MCIVCQIGDLISLVARDNLQLLSCGADKSIMFRSMEKVCIWWVGLLASGLGCPAVTSACEVYIAREEIST